MVDMNTTLTISLRELSLSFGIDKRVLKYMIQDGALTPLAPSSDSFGLRFDPQRAYEQVIAVFPRRKRQNILKRRYRRL